MSKKIVAIVGSYRKGGTIDTAVEAVLAGAREKGAATHTLYLTEQHIEFCTNCRTCTLTPGTERGKCAHLDDLEPILQEIEAADAVVLGSSVNCFNVTAIFRRFLERLLGYAFWPWGRNAPKVRNKNRPRKAVLVASSAMPGIFIPAATGAARALRLTARMLGAKPVGSIWIGPAARKQHQPIPPRKLERARQLGMRLA
jgi:multimeric flavodoxin WrbA